MLKIASAYDAPPSLLVRGFAPLALAIPHPDILVGPPTSGPWLRLCQPPGIIVVISQIRSKYISFASQEYINDLNLIKKLDISGSAADVFISQSYSNIKFY